MKISKKKWKTLEKRIADLEGQVQSQRKKQVPNVKMDEQGRLLVRYPYERRFHYINAVDLQESFKSCDWKRFELITQSGTETEELESVLSEKNLSRKELAIILFSIRVRPGFRRSDFGI